MNLINESNFEKIQKDSGDWFNQYNQLAREHQNLLRRFNNFESASQTFFGRLLWLFLGYCMDRT